MNSTGHELDLLTDGGAKVNSKTLVYGGTNNHDRAEYGERSWEG